MSEIIRASLFAHTAELRAVKRWWRTSAALRPEPPPPGWNALAVLKYRATLLHLALAHARHRQHARTWRGEAIGSRVEQAALLVRVLDRLDQQRLAEPLLAEDVRGEMRRILDSRPAESATA
jgi:hypothetical protein